MGTWLTMETLRQLRLSSREAVLDRLDVVLAVADIDTQVFVSQMDVIGRMKRPMRVLVAADDLALSVSARLAGGRQAPRQHRRADPRVQAAAKRFNIESIDISSIQATDRFKHGRFSQIAAIKARLSNADGAEASAEPALSS